LLFYTWLNKSENGCSDKFTWGPVSEKSTGVGPALFSPPPQVAFIWNIHFAGLVYKSLNQGLLFIEGEFAG